MITHENLVYAVYQSVGAWSCPNGEENCDCDCRECAEKLVKEYESVLRAEGAREYRESLPNINFVEHDKKISNKTIEKFVENLKYRLCYTETEEGWSAYTVSENDISEVAEWLKEGAT